MASSHHADMAKVRTTLMVDDGYLRALAASADVLLVTGDGDLLELGEELPIHAPRAFLALLRVS